MIFWEAFLKFERGPGRLDGDKGGRTHRCGGGWWGGGDSVGTLGGGNERIQISSASLHLQSILLFNKMESSFYFSPFEFLIEIGWKLSLFALVWYSKGRVTTGRASQTAFASQTSTSKSNSRWKFFFEENSAGLKFIDSVRQNFWEQLQTWPKVAKQQYFWCYTLIQAVA